MELKHITETIEGYEVKDLRYKPVDNIIRGFVKCPIWGKKTLHNGFVVCVWRTNGTLLPKYGGDTRKDLYIKINK
jgi:hypothetical protein